MLSQSEVDDLYNDRDDTSTASGANGTIAENSQSQVTEVSTINVVEGVVQTYEYSASDVSWNQIGNTIESASVNDISGGDIAINDEGNMIAIGYPQSKSSIQVHIHIQLFLGPIVMVIVFMLLWFKNLHLILVNQF